MTPLALIALNSAAGVVGSLFRGSSKKTPPQLSPEMQAEFENYLSNANQNQTGSVPAGAVDPQSLVGKNVTVQDDQGQSITGKVEWVDVHSDGYSMKIDGKNYTNAQLKAVEGVPISNQEIN